MALLHDAGDPAIPPRIRYLWRLAEALLAPVGTCIPRGVHKFRTIEEANAHREQYESIRVDRLRAARARKE